MSLNLIPLDVQTAINPVLALDAARKYAAFDGGSDVAYVTQPATAVSNSIINVDFKPPSDLHVLDPRMYSATTYSITFAGTSTVGNLLQADYDAPRFFPTAQCTNVLTINLNSYPLVTQLNEYFNQFSRYNFYYDNEDTTYSLAPSMEDQYQNLGDWVSQQSVAFPANFNQAGSNRNSLAVYGEVGEVQPRGAFPMQITSNTTTAATVIFTSVEPIMMSPFWYARHGMTGVRTMTGSWTLGNLQRVWSHAANSPNTISSITVNVTGFSVFTRWLLPKVLDPIPRSTFVPYNEVQVIKQQAFAPLAPNAVATLNINATNLQAIPRRIMISVRQQDSDLTYATSDAYAFIQNVSLQWMAQEKMAPASQYELYAIAQRNGTNLSWTQWSSQVGSVIAIDCGKDFGLPELDTPGVLSNPQLAIKVQFQNINQSASITYQLNVHVVYEGTFSIIGGFCSKSLGVLTNQDVLNARRSDRPSLLAIPPTNFYGGDLWDSIKSGISSAYNFVKNDVLPVAKDVYNVAKPLLPLVGLGQSHEYEQAASGRRKVGRPKGRRGGDAGGKSISASQLKAHQRQLEQMLDESD